MFILSTRSLTRFSLNLRCTVRSHSMMRRDISGRVSSLSKTHSRKSATPWLKKIS